MAGGPLRDMAELRQRHHHRPHHDACHAGIEQRGRRQFDFADQGQSLLRLCVLLRFAILLHHIRGTQEMPQVQLHASEQGLAISFPDGWLAANPLTEADFRQEAEWLKRVDIELSVR